MKALIAGSFHPPTMGHLDLIGLSSRMFEEVIVAVMVNAEKKYSISKEQRVKMLEKCTAAFSNISVVSDTGLTAALARKMGAEVLVRGVRDCTDFEYERRIADINRSQYGIETVILPTKPSLSSVSSSVVMDLIRHGGNIDGLVPEIIKEEIINAVKKECRL